MKRLQSFFQKFRKTILAILLLIVVIFVLLVVFISPLVKWAIEKYDIEYLGREVKLGWVYVNPFTAYISLNGVKIYEQKSDSIFIQAEGLSGDLSYRKLFSSIYDISDIKLKKPTIHFIQDRKKLNIDDLIVKFSGDTLKDKDSTALRMNVRDIDIINGTLIYDEKSIPVHYWIKELNVKTKGYRYDIDSLVVDIDFKSGSSSGKANLSLNMNLKSLDYKLLAKVDKFDLKIMEQYVKDIAAYANFEANLDCDVSVVGNFNNVLAMTTVGKLAINDLHFGKQKNEDFISFKKLLLDMDKVSPKSYEYAFDSILLDELFFTYKRYDYLDNLQRMFGKNGAYVKAAKADESKFNIIFEIAEFLKKFGDNFLKSHYSANLVNINKANIKYEDYTLQESFNAGIYPMNIVSRNIDKRAKTIDATLRSQIYPYGTLTADFSVNPSNFNDFTLTYNLDKVPLPIFNPFTVRYTQFPLDNGTLDFNGKWVVRNKKINSDNHLIITNPETGRRIKGKDNMWIPVPLILSILRQNEGIIDYEMPIYGDLADPKFNVEDVIFDILKNIFVKPPTTAYRVRYRKAANKAEKMQYTRWDLHATALEKNEKRQLNNLANFLTKNDKATVVVTPTYYDQKEKEHILLYEAKKQWYILKNKTNQLTEKDSVSIERMSIKDSSFIAYLDRNIKGASSMFTVQEKCSALIGNARLDKLYQQLMARRKEKFEKIFSDKGVSKQITYKTPKNERPRIGFSYYRLMYKGVIPEQFEKALEILDEVEDEKVGKKREQKLLKNKKGFMKLKYKK